MSEAVAWCPATLIVASSWALISAVLLLGAAYEESVGAAWGWGASFAVSSLVGAWCFGELL
ncbi:MAG: hypothetical protein M3R38_29915 [Actinomycetota bacterium]|nr:hypothetical protein [Actinomycetota bacterium]